MTTNAATIHPAKSERVFFAVTTLAMAAWLFAGFARSFFLRPAFADRPDYASPEVIYYVHGALFTSWFVLLVAQALLISVGNVRLHMRLGFLGAGIAGLMIIVGSILAVIAAARPTGFTGVPIPADQFLLVPLGDIAIFALFVGIGIIRRDDSATHKRALYLATATILEAGLARIPLVFHFDIPNFENFIVTGFVLALAVWDLFSTKRLHLMTLLGFCICVFLFTRLMIGETGIWTGFARWLIRFAS
ncbi:MAG: hypothetical protein HY286_09415 [Planctomycetes bacterium]|nr:hypothetical protein [Planctomycetota bacterium]